MNFTHLALLFAAFLGTTFAAAPGASSSSSPAAAPEKLLTFNMVSVACDTVKGPLGDLANSLVKMGVHLMEFTKCTKGNIVELDKTLSAAKFTVAKTNERVTAVSPAVIRYGFGYELTKTLAVNSRVSNMKVGDGTVAVYSNEVVMPEPDNSMPKSASWPMWYWLVIAAVILAIVGAVAYFLLK